MKKYQKKICSLLFVFVMISSYLPVMAAEESGSSQNWDTIKVFETTDIHGYITDVSTYNEDTFQYRMAYIANVVEKARENKEYEDVLLLDSGDIYQSTPHSNLTYGAALRAAMDKMKYDAVGLGNHEFDWDVKKYAADANGTMAPYEIGGYQGDPDIPVLMSNLYYADSNQRVEFTRDYTVVQKGDYSVAIVGWSDDYSADIKASQIAPYKIDGNIDKLKEKTEEIKEKENPDVLVVLTHSAPDKVAEAMDPDVVDLVAGGHTHQEVNGTAANGIEYMQGYYYAYGYATTEIKINPENGEVDVLEPTFVEIAPKKGDVSHLYYKNGTNPELNPEITAISQTAWDVVKDDMYEVLCTVEEDITKSFINEKNAATVAGNWLSGLMLDITKDHQTVAAFTNRGGIRTSLVKAEGADTRDITTADIYTITPFGNRILTYLISGKQMAQQLEKALAGLNPAVGIDTDAGYSASNYGDQFSGIHMTYQMTEDGIKVLSIITDSGEVIDVNDDTKMYNVCVNEYCATLPGSVFEHLTPIVPLDEAPVDNLSTIQALQERRDREGLKMSVDTSVRTMSVEEKIAQIEETLNSYKVETVTSADQNTLLQLKEEIGTIMAYETLAESQKEALQTLHMTAEKLLARIHDAANAIHTENIKKAEQMTTETVKASDKAVLEVAKKDLESALQNYKSNYTDEEKQMITEKQKNIQQCLEVIQKNSKNPATRPDNKKNVKSPKTGDSDGMMIFGMLFLIGGVCVLEQTKRSRKNMK